LIASVDIKAASQHLGAPHHIPTNPWRNRYSIYETSARTVRESPLIIDASVWSICARDYLVNS